MSRRHHCPALALLCLFAAFVGSDANAEERGTVLYEYWSGISGDSLSALTNDPRYPDAPSGRTQRTTFEAASNWNDAYGARLRGYLHPSQTGEYRFSIAGDNTCQLWLSTSADPLQKRLIATVPSYTAAREWSRYPQQQSATVVLTAGASYYIEARHKEGAGQDHLAVAWTGPGIGETPTVIAGEYLSPSAIENPLIPPSLGTGSLTVQTWQGLSGSTLSALTGVSSYPAAPTSTALLTSFATASNRGDNYGQRVRGFVCPNITGTYRFWIASDDQSEVLLSTDESPAHAVRIANVPSYTNSLQWDRFPEQQSAEVLLTGGLRYYVEVRHKEGVGGDHLAVAWEGPSQARAVIAGANLAPWPVPIISGQAVFSESATVAITATAPAEAIVYTTDGSLPTAASPRYEAPFTVSSSTVVTAAIIAADGTVGEPTQGVFRKPGTGSGLAAGYYPNENLLGTPIQRIDPVVNFDWGQNAPLADFPANSFSVRWQGEIETALPEPYTLIVRSDDGVRVWIDGELVINDWTYHAARDASTVLPPGRHTLEIEYKEGAGLASAQLLWTSAHTGREVVPSTQLHPLLGVRGEIPPTSPVSPVYLEISHHMGVTPSAMLAGVETPMHHLDDSVHYLNASLTPDLPTAVTISGGTGDPLTGEIIWEPTVVTGHEETVIRVGDSLLLNFPEAGNLSITSNSGIYLPTQAVTGGQLKPVRFTKGGIYIVRLTTPDGIEVATLDVTVVSADLSGVVLAEVGYTRAATVPITPANAPVAFLGNSQLQVSTDSIAQHLADVRLTPLRRGTPRLLARLNGPDGPLIADQAIDEFTIDQSALRSAFIDVTTNIGTSTLVMRPFIPNQRFTMSMFAHTGTFAGGARTLIVDTNGAEASTGEAPMAQQWDAATNEMIGVFLFDLEVPRNENKYCYRLTREQLSPQPQTGAYLPTATGGSAVAQASLLTAFHALMMGTSMSSPYNGPGSNINGDACHIGCDVRYKESSYTICPNKTGTLTATLANAGSCRETFTWTVTGSGNPDVTLADTVTGTVTLNSGESHDITTVATVGANSASGSESVVVKVSIRGSQHCSASTSVAVPQVGADVRYEPAEIKLCPNEAGELVATLANVSSCTEKFTWSVTSDGDPSVVLQNINGEETLAPGASVKITTAVTVDSASPRGTETVTIKITGREGQAASASAQVVVNAPVPLLTGPDVIHIKRGETKTIDVSIKNDSTDCPGTFSWWVETEPDQHFQVDPNSGMTPELDAQGVHTIPLDVTCAVAVWATEGTLTVFAASPNGSAQLVIPIIIVEEDPIGPVMRTVISKIEPNFGESESLGGMPSQYIIHLQSQVTRDGKGVPDLLLLPSFIDGVGGWVLRCGSTLTGDSSGDGRTNENGMIFTQILLDTKFIKGDNDFPYLFYKIDDSSFIAKYNLDEITNDSRANGVIAQPTQGPDGATGPYVPTVASYCGRAPGGPVITLSSVMSSENLKSSAVMGPAAFAPNPQRDLGFANPVNDDGFVMAKFMLDAVWVASKTAGPFGLISAAIGDEKAKAAFFGFFFGVPNGVAAWGLDTIDDFKFLTVTAPTAVFKFVMPEEDIRKAFTLVPLHFGELPPGQVGLWLRIPNRAEMVLPVRIAKKLVAFYDKFKAMVPQIVQQITTTYDELKKAGFPPEDLAKLFIPDYDQRLAASFFTSIYGWNPGDPEYGYGAMGYLGGVVFAYVLTEVTVDVVAAVVTAGAAVLPRMYAIVAKLRKLPELVGLMRKSRFVAAKPTRVRTFFGFGAFMGEVREAERKLPAIMEKFPAGSADEGRLGGLLARGAEASGDAKANEFAKALGKVVDSVPEGLVGKVVLRLARICDSVGRDVPMSSDEIVKIGTALHRWGELEEARKIGNVDIDRDVLGLAADGSANAAGLLKERLKDVLIRCGDLTPAANEGIFKFFTKTSPSGSVQADALRVLEKVSTSENVAGLEKLWSSVNDWTKPKAFDGLLKAGLKFEGEALVKYSDYKGVVKTGGVTNNGHFEDSFVAMERLSDANLDEVAKIVKSVPEDLEVGAVAEHMIRFLTNDTYTNVRIEQTLTALTAIRSAAGELPKGVLTREGAGSSPLLWIPEILAA